MGRTFFGLTPKDKPIFLEHIFAMMYYMGFTYHEAYNIPIWQRRWFIDRLQKEIKHANEQNGGDGAPTRSMQDNHPDVRAMMGRYRSMVPAKLRRFT